LTLQARLRRVLAETPAQRPLDVPGQRLFPLDPVGIVGIHVAQQLRDARLRHRVQRPLQPEAAARHLLGERLQRRLGPGWEQRFELTQVRIQFGE
jgi:hypothetical protein